MLNKAIILTLAIAVLSLSAFAQSDKQIKTIEAQVAAIDNAAGSYKEKTDTIEGAHLTEAKGTFFTVGKQLVKAIAVYEAEGVKGRVEAYYKGGKVIFIKWDANVEKTTGWVLETEKYYFVNGKLLRIVDGSSVMKRGDDNFIEMEREVMKAVADIRDGFEN